MKVTESAILSILSRWRPRLGIDDRWHIDIRIYNDNTWPEKWKGSVADVEASPGYFMATISCNAEALERDGDPLEHNILHELVHIPLWRLRKIAIDALGEDQEWIAEDLAEEATETITKALLHKAVKE